MTLQKKVFENYNKIHGKYLDFDQIKIQKFFDNYVNKNILLNFKDSQVLEIGCGKGFMIKSLATKQIKTKFFGIDLSPEDISFAKEYLKDYSTVKNIQVADAFDYLKDNKNKFDFIICKDVLEHIPKDKLELFLDFINAALTKNGRVFIAVPNMDWYYSQHERYMDITHEVGFTKESLGQLSRLHFNDVKINKINQDDSRSICNFIRFSLLKPILVLIINQFLKIMGDGSAGSWWQSREIYCVGTKIK